MLAARPSEFDPFPVGLPTQISGSFHRRRRPPAPNSFNLPQPVHIYRVFMVAIRSDLMLVQLFIWICANGHWASGPRRDLTPFLSFLHRRSVSEEEGVMDVKTNVHMLAAIASLRF